MIGSYILVAFIALIVGAIIGGCYFDTFKIGAKWMQKKMIDKAYQWIKANMPNYVNFEEGFIYEVDMADDYRQAMEE